MKFLKAIKQDYRVLWHYFYKYRSYYAIGITALIVVDILEVIPPLLLKNAVDFLTTKSATTRNLAVLGAAYVAVSLGQSFMRYLWRMYLVRTSIFAGRDMRDELFLHLTTLAPGFFRKRRIGELVSLSTNDIESVRFALGPGTLMLLDAIFYFCTILPAMFYLSPTLAVISLVPLLIVPPYVRKVQRYIEYYFTKVQEAFSELSAQSQEALNGIRIIKGAALEPFKEKDFAQLGKKYIDVNIRSAFAQSGLNTSLEFFLSLSVTTLFLVGGSLVLKTNISIGVFIAFQRYIHKMDWPMEAIGMAVNIFQKCLASQKRIDSVHLEKNPVLQSTESKWHLIGNQLPTIEARNLNFSYPGTRLPAIKNLSFTLKPGMKLGIIGNVGSGKSTLFQCLLRLEAVDPGQIFINGIDIVTIPAREVRQLIGLVQQDVFLFSQSLQDNVLYGSEYFTSAHSVQSMDYTKNVCEIAAILDDIERLPDKFNTRLGERGINLSGGQKQRLSIARVMARDPKILIFDDCLSAVDSETESKLVHSLTQATKEKSIILCTHRLSSLDWMDWILVMENGEVQEAGTPDDLKKNKGKFYQALKRQTLEKELQEVLL